MTPEREADIRRTWKRNEKAGQNHDWRRRPVLRMEAFRGACAPPPNYSNELKAVNIDILLFEGTIVKDTNSPGWEGLEVRCEGVLVWTDHYVQWREQQRSNQVELEGKPE